ncbi:MAG: patatin-like phospholipase family protein [Ferruginibacter sp.]
MLLVFWYLLTSTINSGFMKTYGADALFFAPEYLGSVNALGAAIVGVAMGVFIMSWNITTFILHSKRCKFLATTSKPFLKYCINNAILPLLFVIFYFARLIPFNESKELMSAESIAVIVGGLLGGFIFLLAISVAYFFGAEKTILHSVAPIVGNPQMFKKEYDPALKPQQEGFGMKVGYYFSTGFHLRKARNVSHYNQDFLDMIFKRHHFAAIVSMVTAFIFLAAVGFFLDDKIFQVPAAASIFIFFSVMTAVIGALTYFLQSWGLPFIIVLLFFINILYRKDIIDPRNKAYGLSYNNKNARPIYSKASLQQLCTPEKIIADKANMLAILENWKKKQGAEKPVMVFINVSGGGLRSGTFVMNALQELDSITKGKLMQHTMLISGASGGMLAATYYRELYRSKLKGTEINLKDSKYTDNIAQDLLNPVFSSMIARDIFAPAQKFTVNDHQYVKDRGYAFEEKLNENSEGVLNKQIKDFTVDEKTAAVPLLVFNSTISRDGRQMMICSQPISFLMKPFLYAADTSISPDAIDFTAFFSKQEPMNLRLLTALRMNATFPYVLPNVWLPTMPVIDVMDAGLRDNIGESTSLRFIENFKDWLQQNTSGIIILQLRDRKNDNWQQPIEGGNITDVITKPATMLQYNWYKLQYISQTNEYSYLHSGMENVLHRINFMYLPEKAEQGAALNFHLTASEKKDVMESFYNSYNQAALKKVLELLK